MSVLIEIALILAAISFPKISGQNNGPNPVSNKGMSDTLTSTINPDFDCQEGFFFSFTVNQCLDVNECSMQPDPCQAQKKICSNTIGSFLCNDPTPVTPLANTITTELPSSSRSVRTTPEPTEEPTTKKSSKNNILGLNLLGLNLGLGLGR